MATARSVRADELDELLSLYRMLNPDDPPLDPNDPEVAETFEAMRADDDLEIAVIEHDDLLVASCVLSITPNLTRGGRPWAVIENVVTHEDYRGRGFGSEVIEYAMEVAAERDCYKVMLLTGTEREWKLDFYEGCGFDRDDKTGFVRYLDGASTDGGVDPNGASSDGHAK